ncbi:hypothetical protein [Rhizobium skierniewicense]|uniref:hypothetical protein n=1 Tax=Rhizobium skierniewicense TaxID=984260 RepID=UPI0015744F8A|nr:hypothetical protein [Rhizobium skierniewicense]NTF34261.1 hypothetical protein [Rhizobium skierniewicense]
MAKASIFTRAKAHAIDAKTIAKVSTARNADSVDTFIAAANEQIQRVEKAMALETAGKLKGDELTNAIAEALTLRAGWVMLRDGSYIVKLGRFTVPFPDGNTHWKFAKLSEVKDFISDVVEATKSDEDGFKQVIREHYKAKREQAAATKAKKKK